VADASAPAVKAAAPGPWAPFGHAPFAVLWVATVISNVGTWMNDVGAGWLMTELSPSPLIVAAVQAATTLPVFLFALLAGAVADIVDRRKMLLVVNVALGITTTALALTVASGLMTPLLLLAFTFLLGTGAAFLAPAWQAVVPRLVPRAELPSAIALNSMGINVSRAIGPALAGALIVGVGLWSPFAVNAASFVVIVAALLWWRPDPGPARRLPPERVGAAIRAGLRYASGSGPLRATLVRAAAFFAFASAYWAMLPLIARTVLDGGATLYGLLLGAVGAGAVGGALVLPRFRAKFGPDRTVVAGTVGTALVLGVFALVPSQAVAIAASALAGVSWIAVLSSLNVSAQTALPDWVRARGLSIFLTVFFGAMSAGSLVWGQVAAAFGIPAALLAAAAGALLLIPLTREARLGGHGDMDLAPSMHWPEPMVAGDAPSEAGPVAIRVAYRVDPTRRDDLLALAPDLRAMRRRNGAWGWELLRDAADPDLLVEAWHEPSWEAHLRHHERVTGEDRALQERLAALLVAGTEPQVTHLLPAR
jgi:MFS family permease/quinol monooxygenase YgiN